MLNLIENQCSLSYYSGILPVGFYEIPDLVIFNFQVWDQLQKLQKTRLRGGAGFPQPTKYIFIGPRFLIFISPLYSVLNAFLT
jgi:hypothetical protein